MELSSAVTRQIAPQHARMRPHDSLRIPGNAIFGDTAHLAGAAPTAANDGT
jgi:hypothetical protein